MFKIENKKLKYIGIIFFVLIFGFLVFKLVTKPQMSFIVEYKDVPAVSDNLFLFRIDVHFRGYDVGDVKKIQLAQDQSHLEFFIDIHYKDLKIPRNSLIMFKTENIYGARYVDIEPPDVPSNIFIANGDVIDGTETFERLDQYLIEEFTKGKTGILVDNLRDITDILKEGLENDDSKKLLTKSAGDLTVILENLRKVTEYPNFSKDMTSVIKCSSGSLKNIDEILNKEEIKEIIINSPEKINKTMDSVESISKNISAANSGIAEVNSSLTSIDNKVPLISESLVENTENLVLKLDCLGSEISKLISKKFLILRLVFANPGKSFKICTKNACCRKTAKK